MRFIIFLALFGISLYAKESPYEKGEYLYYAKACSSCHGPSAEGSSSFPNLANKPQKYITKRLRDLRDGKASSVSQEMMSQFALHLSDEDIYNLSIFLSQHKAKVIEDVAYDLLGGSN